MTEAIIGSRLRLPTGQTLDPNQEITLEAGDDDTLVLVSGDDRITFQVAVTDGNFVMTLTKDGEDTPYTMLTALPTGSGGGGGGNPVTSFEISGREITLTLQDGTSFDVEVAESAGGLVFSSDFTGSGTPESAFALNPHVVLVVTDASEADIDFNQLPIIHNSRIIGTGTTNTITRTLPSGMFRATVSVNVSGSTILSLSNSVLEILNAGAVIESIPVEFAGSTTINREFEAGDYSFRWRWTDSRIFHATVRVSISNISITEVGSLHNGIFQVANDAINARNYDRRIDDANSLSSSLRARVLANSEVTAALPFSNTTAEEQIAVQVFDTDRPHDIDPNDDALAANITAAQWLFIPESYERIEVRDAFGGVLGADLRSNWGEAVRYNVYRVAVSAATDITVWALTIRKKLDLEIITDNQQTEIDANAARITANEANISSNALTADELVAIRQLPSHLVPSDKVVNTIEGTVVSWKQDVPQRATAALATPTSTPDYEFIKVQFGVFEVLEGSLSNFGNGDFYASHGTHATDAGNWFPSIVYDNLELDGQVEANKTYVLKLEVKPYANHNMAVSTLLYWPLGNKTLRINLDNGDDRRLQLVLEEGGSEDVVSIDADILAEKHHFISLVISFHDDEADFKLIAYRQEPTETVRLGDAEIINERFFADDLDQMIIGTSGVETGKVYGDGNRATGDGDYRLDYNPPPYTTPGGYRDRSTLIQATGDLAPIAGTPAEDDNYEIGLIIDDTTYLGRPCPARWFGAPAVPAYQISLKYEAASSTKQLRIYFHGTHQKADLFPRPTHFAFHIGYPNSYGYEWDDIAIDLDSGNTDSWDVEHTGGDTVVVMDIENEVRSDIANAQQQVIREISVNTRHYLGFDSTAFAGSIYTIGMIIVDNDVKDDALEDRLTYSRFDSLYYTVGSKFLSFSLGLSLSPQKENIDYVVNNYARGFGDEDIDALFTIPGRFLSNIEYQEFYITYTKNTTVTAHNGVSFIDRVDFIVIPNDDENLVFQGQGRGAFNFGATAWISASNGRVTSTGGDMDYITFAIYDLNSNTYLPRIDPPPDTITGTSISGVKIEGVRQLVSAV